MIIECFGPAGAGKTTFALALTAHLRREGFRVFGRLSTKPSEVAFMPGEGGSDDLLAPFATGARISTKPELDTTGAKSGAPFFDSASANALATALPRVHVFRVFRMRQYLARLSSAWAKAAQSNDIWIFDQAYIQAVLSIMLVQRRMAEDDVIALLASVPHSDLAFHIATPVEVIQARSTRRRRHIASVISRLFQDQNNCISEQFEIANRLEALLTRSGRRVNSVRSGNRAELESVIAAAASLTRALRDGA